MDGEVFHVSDPRTLKAVAHPLRVRLLGALRNDGPATASELAERFGESSGSTSYHLRQLARYGFVAEAEDRRDRRERRWRSIHRLTLWNNAEMAATPEGREAVAFLSRRQIEVLVTDVEAFERDRDSWGADWIEAAGVSDEVVRLRPSSLAELGDRLHAMLREAAARDRGAPDAEQVSVFVAAHPRRPGPPPPSAPAEPGYAQGAGDE
ncbi:helix-turn-helix transcriptional regulator [Microbispora sp. RL4-1S]|uniref:Helix-turn-helix transcriptional regulator n=1 Tax=Microbispora oryzae TaxID=2806554 RepID=A0A940WLQ1_9ACTN|nr:helix-turn-helix domain-containing protein [Microbispora oryzae]MBP2703386.1 helix-turn-helix transcriptional regulator [Microbispora oryzae]